MQLFRRLGLVLAAAAIGLSLAAFLMLRFRQPPEQHHAAVQTVQVNPAAIRYPRNKQELDELFEKIKNWGRWGPEDQLGAVNLITDQKRLAAAHLVRTGEAVSLSHELLADTSVGVPGHTFEGNGSPLEHLMEPGDLTDSYKVSYHSFLHTHLDALCHFIHDEKLYNGYEYSKVNTEKGCTRLGVENLRNGLVTRGILVDLPKLRNVPYLEPGTPVFAEDLEAWEKATGITIGPGDAVFLRTGRWKRWNELGPWAMNNAAAGFHPSVAAWFRERDVAVVGTDGGLDVLPSPVEGVPNMPTHVLVIAALGMIVLDNHDLESLAEVANRLNRWEFMVTIEPLVVVGGTGSPVNTVALF